MGQSCYHRTRSLHSTHWFDGNTDHWCESRLRISIFLLNIHDSLCDMTMNIQIMWRHTGITMMQHHLSRIVNLHHSFNDMFHNHKHNIRNYEGENYRIKPFTYKLTRQAPFEFVYMHCVCMIIARTSRSFNPGTPSRALYCQTWVFSSCTVCPTNVHMILVCFFSCACNTSCIVFMWSYLTQPSGFVHGYWTTH